MLHSQTILRLLALLALLLATSVPAAASPWGDPQKKNDPATCPYCKNDPALMKKAGLVSHGGFPFGSNDTAQVDSLLATADIRWIESTHFEIGVALGTY